MILNLVIYGSQSCLNKRNECVLHILTVLTIDYDVTQLQKTLWLNSQTILEKILNLFIPKKLVEHTFSRGTHKFMEITHVNLPGRLWFCWSAFLQTCYAQR